MRPRITATLKEIHAKAPNAKVALMGYPPLLEKSGSCNSSAGIGMEEAKWINEVAGVLSTEMNAAVADAGSWAFFSDPKDNFAGKAICGEPEQVHGIVTDLVDSDNPIKDWPLISDRGLSAQSFHPKLEGARLYADSLERTFSGMNL